MKLVGIARNGWLSFLLIGSFATLALGQQESTIESLGFLSTNYRSSIASRVSDDGTVVVGASNGPTGKVRGFRWSVDGGMQSLEPEAETDESVARAVSGDGSIVVGSISPEFYYPENRAVYWTASGERFETYAPTEWWNTAAWGISGDGLVTVGMAAPVRIDSEPHAFRFVAGEEPYDYGSINGNGQASYAQDVSYDGSTVVGFGTLSYQETRAFRWTPETGIQMIGTLPNLQSYAMAVSDDGKTIVGVCDFRGYSDQIAFVWTEASGMKALPLIGSSGESDARDVCRDGSIIVGRCDIPSERSYADRGGACVWKHGKCYSLWDLLENEYPADLEGWSELSVADGISADGTTIVGTGLYRGDKSAFRVVLRSAEPTVDPILPRTVECKGEQNLVTLATDVADDGRRVTVRWKVNGNVVKQSLSVEPGESTLTYDFPHGASLVEVEVSDLEHVATTSTTVTVEDTTAPTVTVTPDVVVPTLPGRNFAIDVALPAPEIFDLCDGEPTLSNNAPNAYWLGTTIVTWTATDADGNKSSATQRVIVADREAPRITDAKDVHLFCDPGELFATADLNPPSAVDNGGRVTVVSSHTGPRFRVGTTAVTWTARDEAGNVAQTTAQVIVQNRTPRADAGKRIAVTVKSERGALIRLDGRGSSDPDGHDLRFVWKAKRVSFSDPKAARPLGSFPVGKTTATLTVIDEGRARDTDRVQIVVRLAASEERLFGEAANRAFERSALSARRGVESGDVSAARLIAFSESQATASIGMATGDRIVWGERGSPDVARLEYAASRAAQAAHGAAAARAWWAAYLEEGDEASFAAALESLQGAELARADLNHR